MTRLKDLIQPGSKQDAEEFALEALSLSLQVAIQKSMESKGVSRSELAERMNVSRAWISQLLGDGHQNINLKTLAKVSCALDETFEFATQDQYSAALKIDTAPRSAELERFVKEERTSLWKDATANSNRFPHKTAA